MKAFITKITPWFPRKVRIQWDLEEATESGVFNFTVERSGSPSGDWVTVASLPDAYMYDDMLTTDEVNILSLSRDLYYRVKVTPPSGDINAFYSPIVNLDGQAQTNSLGPRPGMGFVVLDTAQYEVEPLKGQSQRAIRKQNPLVRLRLLRRKILRDEYIRLRQLVGVEFLLLKRRHFGARCTKCYDPITREVTLSRCLMCYGTSFSGGYFAPVLILGAPQTSQVQTEISPQTKDDIRMQRIQFLDFPKIDEGDVLVQKAHNRRFLVKQRYYTSLKMVPVHQTITASELERQAIEYEVPVTL